MDDYVRSIKEEVKTQGNIEKTPDTNYRILFSKFIASTPKIKLESVNGGDVLFSISIKDVELTYQELQRCRIEVYSYLAVNFMGELLVRENIDIFAEALTKVDKDRYSDIVNGFEHKKFGLKIMKNRLYFSFHISLVQSILNEDFRREVRLNLEKS